MQRNSLFNTCCPPEDESERQRKRVLRLLEKKINQKKCEIYLRYGILAFVSLMMFGVFSAEGYLINETAHMKANNASDIDNSTQTKNGSGMDYALEFSLPGVIIISLVYIWFVKDMLSISCRKNFSQTIFGCAEGRPYLNIEQIKQHIKKLKIGDLGLKEEEKKLIYDLDGGVLYGENSLIFDILNQIKTDDQEKKNLLQHYV